MPVFIRLRHPLLIRILLRAEEQEIACSGLIRHLVKGVVNVMAGGAGQYRPGVHSRIISC